MPAPTPNSAKRGKGRCIRLLRWLLTALRVFILFLLITWAALALIYSHLPWTWARVTLASALVAFSIWSLWVTRRRRMRWAFAAAFLAVLAWFISVRPSNDRPWRPEVAVVPRAVIDGDHVHLTGVRNFNYRTRDDFDIRYEDRDVSISDLTSVDFYISYWTPGPVAHTFLSFCFAHAPPVCISIEVRPEIGESFNPVGSMFKMFELIYIVGDERDIVRLRTNYRSEDVFLYHILAPPDASQRLFRIYLDRINQLADHPEFYHLLSNNCTLNIFRYANAAGRTGGFPIGHLINGWVDRYLYRSGTIDTSLPFDESRRRAHINAAAQAADQSPDFSDLIRRSTGLPPGAS
jgi:hypothetical protein